MLKYFYKMDIKKDLDEIIKQELDKVKNNMENDKYKNEDINKMVDDLNNLIEIYKKIKNNEK